MIIPAGLKNHLISSVTANVACLRLALTRPSWAFGTDLCGVHGPMGPWAHGMGTAPRTALGTSLLSLGACGWTARLGMNSWRTLKDTNKRRDNYSTKMIFACCVPPLP